MFDVDQARLLFQANQERVLFRQAATAHREQLKLDEAWSLQQEQQDREDRLAQLRAQVCVPCLCKLMLAMLICICNA